jgi:DNA adenine methylase
VLIAKPFVKWVGGKRKIINHLLAHIPFQINNYYEPFVGAGALFFEIANKVKHSYLSDLNIDLINSYQTIKTKPLELIEVLKIHKKNNCKDYYCSIRSKQDLKNVENAARLIYLLATCFNGLYRVNKKNIFNAAFGYYKEPKILDEDNLKSVHQVLQNTTITHQDFLKIEPQKGDFVYFDPPYFDSYSDYTKQGFTRKDQERLRDFALHLSNKKVNVLISNSNTDFIKKLYKNDFEIIEITTKKTINPNHIKPSTELLIKNYETSNPI